MMQTKRTYHVQHWPNGQWDPGHNWRKIEAATEKEAAEKVCGLPLSAANKWGRPSAGRFTWTNRMPKQ